MNRDIMPTIDEYVKYSLLVEDAENSMIELEKLIIKAKKERITAYNRGDTGKVQKLDMIISEYSKTKNAKEEEFKYECLFRYYMSSTYLNFSKELNEEELKHLIERLNKKIRELSSRVKTLGMIKMKSLEVANNVKNEETIKKSRELSSSSHTELLRVNNSIKEYENVKDDLTKILTEKEEKSSPRV